MNTLAITVLGDFPNDLPRLNEWKLKFVKAGNGSQISKVTISVSEATTARVSGLNLTNAQGNVLSDEINLSTGWNYLYVKAVDEVGYLYVKHGSRLITELGDSTDFLATPISRSDSNVYNNAPFAVLDFDTLPVNTKNIYSYYGSTVTGNVNGLTKLKDLFIFNINNRSSFPAHNLGYGLSGELTDNLSDTVVGFTLYGGADTCTINVDKLPKVVGAFNYSLTIGGTSVTVTGKYSSLSRLKETLNITANNQMIGTVADIPRNITNLTISNSPNLTGNIADMPTGLTHLSLLMSPNVTGSIHQMPTSKLPVIGMGVTLSAYTKGKTFYSPMQVFEIQTCNALDAQSTENVLYDLSQVAAWEGRWKTVKIRTSADLTANAQTYVQALQSKGATVSIIK